MDQTLCVTLTQRKTATTYSAGRLAEAVDDLDHKTSYEWYPNGRLRAIRSRGWLLPRGWPTTSMACATIAKACHAVQAALVALHRTARAYSSSSASKPFGRAARGLDPNRHRSAREVSNSQDSG